ncbi:MAG: periplasmic heavy metal sensor [Pseudomonadota bacterium]
MGRGLMIALVASLGLNIFAVGFLSGRVLNDPPAGPPQRGPGGEQSFRLMHYADALPPERRAEFREAFRAQLPAMRDDFREMRRLRMELSALLGAEEFDRAAVAAKFDAIQDVRDQQQAAFGEAFLDAFETLTPEERQMLREAAESRRGKGRRGHRGKHFKRMHDAPPEEREEG